MNKKFFHEDLKSSLLSLNDVHLRQHRDLSLGWKGCHVARRDKREADHMNATIHPLPRKHEKVIILISLLTLIPLQSTYVVH